MNRLKKALLILAFAGLFWWLWESRGARKYWRDAAFVTDATVSVPADERVALASELHRIMAAAGVDMPVAVNAPYSGSAINVYITKASKSETTGCRPGDARYEPTSDVVLLDENVVWPLSTTVTYSGVSISGTSRGSRSGMPKIWLHFAFLHELGHRQLHRGLAPRLRRAPAAVLESEADTFALGALAQLAAKGEYENDNQLGVIHVSSALSGADRSAAVIASLIQHLSVSLLFGGSHFSPFHADSAHAAFVSRFKPRLYEALARTTSQAGRSYVLLALAYLDRVDEAGRGVVADIYSVEPVHDVSFADTDLLVTVAGPEGRKGTTFRVNLRGLSASDLAPRKILLPDDSTAGVSREMMSATPHTPRPSSKAIMDGTEWLLVDERGALTARRSDEDLRKDLQAQTAMTELQTRNCTVGITRRPPRVDVVFGCREDASFSNPPDYVYYVGELDPNDLRIRKLDGVLGPRPMPGEAQTPLDMMVNGVRQTYVMADTIADRHTHRFELRVTRLRPRGPVVASRELVLDWIPTGAEMREWFRVNHPAVIFCRDDGDGLATCTEFLDSVFSFDPRRKTLSTLFYPAGAEMVVGPATQRAFFAKGGHKVFVVQASRPTHTSTGTLIDQ
ncbi:MAG: hypothetical protein ABI779_09275 [Acidobacteriota bacterium]